MAADTEACIPSLPTLDLTHLIAEPAQHSGHADIIRVALDGGRTMG